MKTRSDLIPANFGMCYLDLVAIFVYHLPRPQYPTPSLFYPHPSPFISSPPAPVDFHQGRRDQIERKGVKEQHKQPQNLGLIEYVEIPGQIV